MSDRAKQTGEAAVRMRKVRLVTWVAASIAIIAGAIVLASLHPGSQTGAPGAVPSRSTARPEPSNSSTPSSAPVPSSTVVPVDPDPAVDVPGGVVVDVAQIDVAADFGTGVTARVVSVEPISAKGNLAGEISGPALRVELRLSNGTSAPVDLGGSVVNFDYSPDRLPASPYDSLSKPFSGSIAPGAISSATYVFAVPIDNRSVFALSVSYGAEGMYVVFQP